MNFKETLIRVLAFIIVAGILYIMYDLFFGKTNVLAEGFRVKSQNFVTNNSFDNANNFEYGGDKMQGMFQQKSPVVSGPSNYNGVNKNSGVDIYDNRGFKWNDNGTNPEVDAFVNNANDIELRNKFERTYMLDPDGDVAPYDLTNNKMSPNCCASQYSPPFKVTSENESNCDYAQKYVANQYSGMSFDSNAGCLCVTPRQSTFYGARGGNASI